MYALINPCSPICNMQLNVLNDLAEAMKALDGKKNQAAPKASSSPVVRIIFQFGGFP